MACPASGKITLQDLVNEFGGSAPHNLTEYYRNGSLVPGNNTSVPESGQISLTNFYSAVNEIIHTHSSNATNQNYATVFGSNWSSSVPKRIVINSGVTIGGTSGNHAMTIPSGMGGTLVIDNSGSIQGHGGSANGGTGGNAIHCIHTSGVTVNNKSGGNIKAGGGGGGQGGTGGRGGNGGSGGNGGAGRYTSFRGQAGCSGGYGSHSYYWSLCVNYFGISSGYRTGNWACAYTYNADVMTTNCYEYVSTSGGSGGAGGSSGGAGGAGGAGGRGQGYNQSAQNGSGGSAGAAGGSGSGGGSGGTNAGNGGTGGARGQGGTGGTGGNGGSFGNAGANGNSGATGNTGATGSSGSNGNISNGSGGSSGSGGLGGSSGSAGGSAGYYIYNRSSITFNSLAGSSTAGN